ncbi:LacI family DNA-binding transcriptional regulator [Paenibacillus glufosinatiresistens]|uniref:LacI family DNA-binding transcriptional regulator n=1 Tax=Paenibacillus glufosinatiresistens TaxID=3070657 RepID=UPI00286E158C|nr:LacI family DNA-binding transcriptional regulator [Paenibacillus sp. YX.27]
MRKATMKDIAARANVSVATVSYVLNRVQGQSIPPKTQALIREIAEELHYVPNLAARSLGSRRTGLIGLLVYGLPAEPFWKQQSQSSFIRSLERLLTAGGYHVLLMTIGPGPGLLDIVALRKLDAVLVIDVPEDAFYPVSRHFVEGVPLITIDSFIEDRLFHQIAYDYGAVLKEALGDAGEDVCLITESFHNGELNRYIADSSGLPASRIYRIGSSEELDNLLENAPVGPAVVINEFLASRIAAAGVFSPLMAIPTGDCPELLGPNVRVYPFQGSKAREACRLLEILLHHPEQLGDNNRHCIR